MWAAWGRAAPSCPHADCCSTFSKATGSLRMSRGHCVDPALLVPCPKCPCGACWLWGLSPRSLETPGRLLLVGMGLIPTEEERPAGRGLGTTGHGGVQRGEVAVSPAGHHPWALQGPSLCPPQPWAHVCSAGDGDADPGQRSCEPPHKHLFLVPEAPRGRRAPRKMFGGWGADGHGGGLVVLGVWVRPGAGPSCDNGHDGDQGERMARTRARGEPSCPWGGRKPKELCAHPQDAICKSGSVQGCVWPWPLPRLRPTQAPALLPAPSPCGCRCKSHILCAAFSTVRSLRIGLELLILIETRARAEI